MRSRVTWAVLWAVGCGGDDATTDPGGDVAPSVVLIREPAEGPDPFVVRVGHDDVVVRIDGVETAGEVADGATEVRVAPEQDGVRVEIEVEAAGHVVRRTALVLEVGDAWGQPELVPGLVNTPAYEDGPEISPDGQWLLVSNYAPVDLVSCLFPGTSGLPDPATPACNAVLGPIAAPERPDLPGADRVVDGDVVHAIPELGLVGEDGGDFLVPLPPVAAYGFHRQPDGSFAEPFVIAYDMYGLNNAPFGLSFVEGRTDRILFAWDDVSSLEQDGDLFVADLTVGAPNWLGTVDATFQVDPAPTPWPVADSRGLQSNGFVVPGGVLYDQHLPESGPDSADVYFDDGETVRVAGFCRPDREEFQPFVHEDQLVYVTGGFQEIVTADWDGGDLTDPASFGPEALVVRGVGRIPAVGEPSVGVHDGVPTVYFLAGTLPEGGGIDNTIARVPAR